MNRKTCEQQSIVGPKRTKEALESEDEKVRGGGRKTGGEKGIVCIINKEE